ncbi:IclR family transcriptional regulator [Halosimplex carlsbadense 2-9-1]|uniref:IclR family transcriptional regulator n=1 Tax=Halosimplex carlsbadense 2-9-1 TaxID=797114 RepID=M0CWE5_9EURY|nr:IclR family transcriptional regulator [Halosimplex carlsbadense]ELZ27536.1 IclR family transcriptional regulator [Halosimplex carlsbadense 2-9-1]
MSENAKHPIKSVGRSVRILETLKDSDWHGVTEISRKVDLNKGSVHHHLSTLKENGFVVEEDGKYRLGMRFLEFGIHARNQMKLYEVAKPKIDELAEETGELANLMIEENGLGVYLYIAGGDQALSLDTKVGTQQYLHTCALGKTILAHLPDPEVDRILQNHGLPEETPNTVTDREDLFRELEQVRERGLAFDGEERAEGIRCVAAPIRTNDGELLGAVSVSGPASRMKQHRFKNEIADLVENTATVIQINATYG